MDKVIKSTSENEKVRGSSSEEWISMDVGQNNSQHLSKTTLGVNACE